MFCEVEAGYNGYNKIITRSSYVQVISFQKIDTVDMFGKHVSLIVSI